MGGSPLAAPAGALTDAQLYAYMLAYADSLIGQIVAAAPENTVVALFTDNGGPGPIGGGKGRLTEDGVNVPAILAGPGVLAGRSSALVSVTDLLPTLTALAGAPQATVDGMDLSALLAGQAGPQRLYVASMAYRQEWMVADRNWKLVVHPDCDRKPALCNTLHLYNLRADPNETRPITPQKLTAATRRHWRRLREVARAWGIAS